MNGAGMHMHPRPICVAYGVRSCPVRRLHGVAKSCNGREGRTGQDLTPLVRIVVTRH